MNLCPEPVCLTSVSLLAVMAINNVRTGTYPLGLDKLKLFYVRPMHMCFMSSKTICHNTGQNKMFSLSFFFFYIYI